MGITMGASKLPEKLTSPLNDKIATMCINLTSWGVWIPKTVTELTDRVLRVTPRFLELNDCNLQENGGYTLNCHEGDDLYSQKYNCPAGHYANESPRGLSARELSELSPFVVRHQFANHLVLLDYLGEPCFKSGVQRELRIIIINSNICKQQMWCHVQAYAPEGVKFPGGQAFDLQLNTLYGDKSEAVFMIDASEFNGSKLEIVFDISMIGRHTSTPVKAALLRE
jgi:hypothetical protein